jgi:transcriptional regulator with XRE-family HTH domain
MAGRSAPPELVHYVRHLIERELAKTGMTATELAGRIGISKGQISLLRSSDRGVGWVTITGIERAMNMKPGQLQAESFEYAKAHPLPQPNSKGDRFPNRAEAARFARANRVSEMAIRTVENLDLKTHVDPTPLEWFEMMRDEERRQKFIARDMLPPVREPEPRAAEPAKPKKKSKK